MRYDQGYLQHLKYHWLRGRFARKLVCLWDSLTNIYAKEWLDLKALICGVSTSVHRFRGFSTLLHQTAAKMEHLLSWTFPKPGRRRSMCLTSLNNLTQRQLLEASILEVLAGNEIKRYLTISKSMRNKLKAPLLKKELKIISRLHQLLKEADTDRNFRFYIYFSGVFSQIDMGTKKLINGHTQETMRVIVLTGIYLLWDCIIWWLG